MTRFPSTVAMKVNAEPSATAHTDTNSTEEARTTTEQAETIGILFGECGCTRALTRVCVSVCVWFLQVH